MNGAARSSAWAREVLTGRMIWRPLGVGFALWAWFGWLTPWFTALLPYGHEARVPNPAFFILGAALLGHVTAVAIARVDASGMTAAVWRLIALLGTLAGGWWAYVGAPLGALARSAAAERVQWQATWVVVLILGYAWWRGVRMTTSEALDPETTLRRLFTGALLAAAAIILVLNAWRAGGLVFLPLYLGGGLAGVTLGQIEDSSRRRGGRPLPFGMTWHAGLLLGVAAVIALGVVAGLALASDPAWIAADAVARALSAVARILATILAPVVEALIRLLGPIFDAIVGLPRSWMEGAGEPRIVLPAPPSFGADEGKATDEASRVLAQLGVVLRILITAAGVGVLLWMALRTTNRRRSSAEGREPDEFEPMSDPAARGAGAGLAGILRSVARWPGRARGLVHAFLVRRVYAQLLDWAAGEGRPRRPAETPLEFGVALEGLRPDLREDLDAITHAYLLVRYGEIPESTEMISAVLASWDRVRRSKTPARLPGEGNSW